MITKLESNLSDKLREIRAIDQDILMVYFKDGEVIYKDTGEGPGACFGHGHSPDDDQLIRFGNPLDTGEVSCVTNWRICSDDDPDYSREGLHPVQIHRRAKVMNTDFYWNYALDHWVYLHLPFPLKQDKHYRILIDPSTQSDLLEHSFRFDIYQNVSEAVHVNILGYPPAAPVKGADLYYWLGDGGPRDYRSFEGKQIWLFDVDKKISHPVGNVRFWMNMQKEQKRNLTGSPVWNLDFSEFNIPGRYRLVVEDVGCSMDFDINRDVFYEAYKTSLRGFYYMRLGESDPHIVPIPRQPLFIPNQDPEGFKIYLTDLHPWHQDFIDYPGDTWDEPHYRKAEDCLFYRHRLAGNPVNEKAKGGHADAMDWDRRLEHVSIIYDLLLPYILSDGLLDHDQLGISESGNGIPDLLDEARNEVDFWLSARDSKGAYSHGITNPDKDHRMMFQAAPTAIAAWANAFNTSMMAQAFAISGHSAEEAYYTQEAITAFKFADSLGDPQLDVRQDIGDSVMRGRDFKVSAAAWLYNVTGDKQWENILFDETVIVNGQSELEQEGEYNQFWATAAYLVSKRIIHYPELKTWMKKSVLYQARNKCSRYMDKRPSRRSSVNKHWQTPHNMHRVILAHYLSESPEDRIHFEKSLYLDAEWALGRNPGNIVEMTGLGQRHIENCYTTGNNDGTPGLHPGHTPYNNLGSWGGTHNGSHPEFFTQKGYPHWEDGWPVQEGHFNCRYSWANGEFTPQQTMRGKMFLYAYLYFLRFK